MVIANDNLSKMVYVIVKIGKIQRLIIIAVIDISYLEGMLIKRNNK